MDLEEHCVSGSVGWMQQTLELKFRSCLLVSVWKKEEEGADQRSQHRLSDYDSRLHHVFKRDVSGGLYLRP